MNDPVEMTQWAIGLCLNEGFALAGVTPARNLERAAEFRSWLKEGRHGEMAWLEEDVDQRIEPERFVRHVRSFIMVADRYALKGDEPAAIQAGSEVGRIARYARGRDYHREMKSRLHRVADAMRIENPGHVFRSFVDTAPVHEREHAVRAGLGWIGKHTLLIHRSIGSYVVLGGIATTLALEPAPGMGDPTPDGCGSCTRCIDACPTKAITPYSVDARRCISYLTIERRSAMDPAVDPPIGEWLFGCDVCQEVCPYNAVRAGDQDNSLSLNKAYEPRWVSLPLRDVMMWTDADRAALTASAMKRASTGMLRRNAILSLGRGGDTSLLKSIADNKSESPMLRQTALAVISSTVAQSG